MKLDPELEATSIDIENVAAKHKTPFFIYYSDIISKNICKLRNAFRNKIDVFYSFKANPNMSICALMLRNSVHAEVSSLAELLLAKKIGFQPNNIIFVGPGKSQEELEKAVDMQIYSIVVENVEEMAVIESICKKFGKKARIALRINPDFSITDAPLKMGGVATQFGLTLDEIIAHSKWFQNEAYAIIGLHVYNGTRILNASSISENCKKIFALTRSLVQKIPIQLEMLDMGGGFGIPYFEGEQSLDLTILQTEMEKELLLFKTQFPKTRLIVESGRFLVGNAGSLFSKVLYCKESYGKKFAITDGGINCHMAATAFGSFLRRNFPIARLRQSDEEYEIYTITGPLCTPSDVIGQNILLQKLKRGDLIQVGMSGAYGPSASPGLFLSHGFPKEILIYQGRDYVVREKDTYENIFQNHINIFTG